MANTGAQLPRDEAAKPAAGTDPYAPLLAAYLLRTATAFSAVQTPEDAPAAVVEAATTDTPRFRTQTSDTASTFARLSLRDLNGGAVLAQTATWLR